MSEKTSKPASKITADIIDVIAGLWIALTLYSMFSDGTLSGYGAAEWVGTLIGMLIILVVAWVVKKIICPIVKIFSGEIKGGE